MQEPALSTGRAVHAIALPKNPVARSGLVFDEEIVPDAEPFRVANMPLTIDAFRPVSTLHAAPRTAPDEMDRRMIGKQRHRIDLGVQTSARVWAIARASAEASGPP